MRHIRKAAALMLAALTIASCSDNNKFTVEGQIDNAKDSMLYFENVGLEGINTLDSVKLSDKGDFTFRQEAPGAPEFYRLRIADQIINVSIDSTETVQIKGSYPAMASNYTVSGSDNCEKIKALALNQMDLQNRIIAIQKNPSLSIGPANDSIQRIIAAYKEDVKRNYIYKEPMKAYSYFALFQAIGNYLIFNPNSDKDDIKAFAAVATSWDTYYPHAERGQNLHNIAIKSMKDQRIIASQNRDFEVDASKVSEAGVLDIALVDNKGQERHLTDLKGKVVLLDFHMFGMKESAARILSLRDLYAKYHSQGLEIYQVGLDENEHFWKQQTETLPWICVYDPSAQSALHYNVQNVPEYFLIDRNSQLYKRSTQMKDVEAEIQNLLK